MGRHRTLDVSLTLIVMSVAAMLLGGSAALTIQAQNVRELERSDVAQQERINGLASSIREHVDNFREYRKDAEERMRHLEAEASTMRGAGIAFGIVLGLLQGGQLIMRFRSGEKSHHH